LIEKGLVGMRVSKIAIVLSLACVALSACVSKDRPQARHRTPIKLNVTVQSNETVVATYSFAKPTVALHYAQYLGGYRSQDWRPEANGFRWIKEGDGERVERADGKPFSSLRFIIPIRYRALPKSYAPFSPFSEGSALIHTGQFHACLAIPCDGMAALPIEIAASGKVIGVEGHRVADRTSFVSTGEGTSAFVGTLAPVEADGFVAIIDPGLPVVVRDHLKASLLRSMSDFAGIYGGLSFHPDLYVSIDARPRKDGRESTQGGVLPRQVFMHFDGATASKRVAEGSPFWLDWFFAHEAAHLFQQDKAGGPASDDQAAWIHEGGADALAALSLASRGNKEMAYVAERVGKAGAACAKGLAIAPLDQATSAGNFDLHYQCGMLIWLALDNELRGMNQDGLHALNKTMFSLVRAGASWNEQTFMSAVQKVGASRALLDSIEMLSHGGYTDSNEEIAALRKKVAVGSLPN